MNLLREIGLGEFCDDENFFANAVLRYAIEEGEVFKGYYGSYVWKRLGYVELNCHISPCEDGNCLSGFTSNVSGNNFLRLAVTTHGEIEYKSDEDEQKDYLTRTIVFTNPETHEGNIAINLVNADVAPDFYPDDQYTLQVVAVAHDVTYYKDEVAYGNDPLTTMKGLPIRFALNNVVSLFEESIVTGEVKAVNNKSTFDKDGNVLEFYSVEINTIFGVIEIIHSEETIKDGQKELIKPGSIVKAVCNILGDIAVDEYQQGAIFDEEHLVRLLRGCFETLDFTRVSQLLSNDCKYISKTGEIRAEGGKKVLQYLQLIADTRIEKQLPLYAYPAELIGYDETQKSDFIDVEHKIGTHFIVLAHNDEGRPDTPIFIKIDKDKKISEIRAGGEEYGFYKCRINFPRNDSVEINPDNLINKSFTESEWLDMLSQCYLDGKFDDDVFYYSMDSKCKIGVSFNKEKDIESVEGREAIFQYLSKQIPDGERKITTELIDGSKWGHEKALKVSINGNKHICVIDVNENGYLQTLHEYL